MSGRMIQSDTSHIVACTISRNIQNFDLLIEDMEALLGETWGDLGFAEALAFFAQPEARSLEFIALALDAEDEENIGLVSEVISQAKLLEIRVLLIAEDLTPTALHQLLRQGADEFVPYPIPDNELKAAIKRLETHSHQANTTLTGKNQLQSGSSREGAVIVVHGLAGGVGATTMAVNLAWELATTDGENSPSVCLLDFDLQFGSVATYLDLPKREAILEMLTDTENMDEEVFGHALLKFEDRLQVLTAPEDMVPLDLVSNEDMERVISLARSHFDYVIIDMPSTLVQWSETVLQAAHVYFAIIELDMRSAQNTLRMKRALQSEDLPIQKLRFALNRAPKFTDLSGKSRVKRMAESLGISIDLQLPEGGKQVTQSGDHGQPLALSAPKNPLRKEIAKLAHSLHELGQSETEAA